MGLFGGGNSRSESNTSNVTNNNDNRQVDTANGAGALVAQSGSTFNLTVNDKNALGLAGSAVDQSLSLATQIAKTLGASVGQFSTNAAGSIDGLGHLIEQQQGAVTDQAGAQQLTIILSLGMVAFIAYLALNRH